MQDKENYIQTLLNKKQDIGDERDLCAELYNVWITKLHDFEDDPARYNMYMELISFMEPYANKLKEEIREINRQLCEIEGVDSISETNYVRLCNNKHGLLMPNSKIE